MYQSYENYPTFTVALWFGNDREQKQYARYRARSWGTPGEIQMAEWLRKRVEQSFTDDGVTLAMYNSGSVAGTLLGHVMNQVDWMGLARKYISDEKEEGS